MIDLGKLLNDLILGKQDSNNVESLIKQSVELAQQQLREFESTTVKCGVIGLTGAGKSALINGIFGRIVTAEGETQTTDEPISRTYGKTTLVDLPGIGTKKWPKDQYIESLELDRDYDCYILVLGNRVLETDHFLYDELAIKRNKPVFVVRSQMDSSFIKRIQTVKQMVSEGSSEKKSRLQIEEELIQQIITELQGEFEFHANPPSTFYLVSPKWPKKWDFAKLIKDVQNSVSGIKRQRLIADMAAYNKDAVKLKREPAMRIVNIYSVLAGGNGANPVPGVNIAIDIGLLSKMALDIIRIYGLTNDQLQMLEKILGPSAAAAIAAVGKRIVASITAQFISRQGIEEALKRLATIGITKEAAHFFPMVGQVIGVGLGFALGFLFGRDVIDKCEVGVLEILDALSEETVSVG